MLSIGSFARREHVKVTSSVDVSSESGADFFYDIINAPTLNCAIIAI